MPRKSTPCHACGKPCGRGSARLATYCRNCIYEFKREQGRRESQACSVPPAPPPGYSESDQRTAIPYGSSHAQDSAWADGTRPAGFHVTTLGALPWR